MSFQIEECRAPAVAFDLPPVTDAATISLQLVDAAADNAATAEFFRNKADCYRRFGSEAAITYGKQAASGLHLILAYDQRGCQVGGVGIYVRGDTAPLPLEIALGGESCVAEEIATWTMHRCVVEFSGLWIGERWRKSGLSRELLVMAMAGAHHLRASRVVGFSHHHVTEFYRTVGLTPHPTASRFHYPHPPYVSMLVWGDPVDFSTIPDDSKADVLAYATALRSNSPIGWTP